MADNNADNVVEGETTPDVATAKEDVADATPEDNEGKTVAEGEPATEEAKTRRSVFENHRLETYIYKPEGTPKALLYLCHGVNEHMGCHEKLAIHLKNEGILVFGMDLVGFGKSEGVRGHINEVQSYVTDIRRYVEDMKAIYPDIPMFIFGHSMGGMIACMLTIQSGTDLFSGLLLSSASLVLPTSIGPFKKKLFKLLGFVKPQMGLFTIDPVVMTTMPEEVEAYRNNPLVIHAPLKAGWLAAMTRVMEEHATRYGELTLPLFVMHGDGDDLIPIAASELVYRTASSKDKVYEVFVGSLHEIFHDIEQDRAREMIGAWIKARI